MPRFLKYITKMDALQNVPDWALKLVESATLFYISQNYKITSNQLVDYGIYTGVYLAYDDIIEKARNDKPLNNTIKKSYC